MSNWNASNYLQRKAQRRALTKPEWFKNPDTGEEFYLRPLDSLMSNVLDGYLPGGLTAKAVAAWKEQGVEGMPDPDTLTASIASTLTPEELVESDRKMQSTSLTIQQSCVLPLLSKLDPSKVEFTAEWKADAIRGLKEKDPHFDESAFNPMDYVLHPKDLDGKDASFLYSWARGYVGLTAIKGGGVANLSDIERFRKKPARGSRSKPNESKVREAS